jgi:hypothetical protein
LVLSREVREAIAKDKFHVWPISTVEAGIEILTSVKAGVMRPDGTYPPGTLMRQVQDRLDELRKHADLARSAGVRKTAIPSAAVRAARRHSDESEWPDEVGDRARGSRR